MKTFEEIANGGPPDADTQQADLVAAADALRTWVRTLRLESSDGLIDSVDATVPERLPIPRLIPNPIPTVRAELPAPEVHVVHAEEIPSPRPLVETFPDETTPARRARTIVATATVVMRSVARHLSAMAARTGALARTALLWLLRQAVAFARWAWPHTVVGLRTLWRVVAALTRGAGRLAVSVFATAQRRTPEMKRLVSRLAVTSAAVALLTVTAWAARSSWGYWQAQHKTGTALLESEPTGSDVVVDGTPVGQTPYTAQLTPGHHVVVFKRRRAERTLMLDVVGGQSISSRIDWNARPLGRLRVLSDPIGAQVTIDGTSRGVTPLTLEAIPAGTHTVVLKGDGGTVRQTVDVKADQQAEISEAIYSGWLQVSSPIALDISDGTRAIDFNDQTRVLIAAGPHTIRLQNRDFGFREDRRIDVKPGAVVSIVVRPKPSTLSVTSSVAAEVLIDGVPAGATPLLDYPVNLGSRTIIVKSASGEERRRDITATVEPARLEIDFSTP